MSGFLPSFAEFPFSPDWCSDDRICVQHCHCGKSCASCQVSVCHPVIYPIMLQCWTLPVSENLPPSTPPVSCPTTRRMLFCSGWTRCVGLCVDIWMPSKCTWHSARLLAFLSWMTLWKTATMAAVWLLLSASIALWLWGWRVSENVLCL